MPSRPFSLPYGTSCGNYRDESSRRTAPRLLLYSVDATVQNSSPVYHCTEHLLPL
jgi:hypothetical protein